MVKETSIYNKILSVLDKNLTSHANMQNIADFINQEYDIKINFCEIFGKRWSFLCGPNIIFPEKKIKLTDNIGIITSSSNIDENLLLSIIYSLNQIKVFIYKKTF